ncbi:MAG: hypothetical protein ACLR1T_12645 [Evtepia gabavorous]
MINFEEKTAYTVEDLRRIVHLLRAPGDAPGTGRRPMRASGATSWRRPMRWPRPSTRKTPPI